GYHRQLHRKGDKKTEHDGKFRATAELRAQEFRILEGVNASSLMVEEVQRQNRDQHQQAAALREQEKLGPRVHAPFVSPDDDEEVHRDQHQFPGKIKEEQIHRQEHAYDSRQNPHQIEVEEADFLLNFGPGTKHGDDAEEEREYQHQEAETVHGKMEMDAEVRDPVPVDFRDPARRRTERPESPDARRQSEIRG